MWRKEDDSTIFKKYAQIYVLDILIRSTVFDFLRVTVLKLETILNFFCCFQYREPMCLWESQQFSFILLTHMEILHAMETVFLQHSNICDSVIGIARLWM